MAVAASVAAVAASQQTRLDRQLQDRADSAALAGVNALAATSGLSDVERVDAAVSAARASLTGSHTAIKSVTSSTATASVEVTLEGVANGVNVRSVAHYVQPGDAIAPQRASSLTTVGPAGRVRL